MTVDLTPALHILLMLASAAVTAAIPILVPALLKRLNMANNTALLNALTNGCEAAAGVAYKAAASYEGGLSSVPVYNAALGAGVNHVLANFPDTLKQLGVTPEKVQSMVSARLGILLASDPTVTAGTPVAAPTAEPAPVVAVVAESPPLASSTQGTTP